MAVIAEEAEEYDLRITVESIFAGKRLRKILLGFSLLGRYGSSEEHNDTSAYGKTRLYKCGLCR